MVLQESGVLSASTPSSPQTAATLRRLLDETSDLIESPSFSRILTLLNNEGFSTLVDKKCATHAFKSSSTSEPTKAAALQSFSSSATIVPAADASAPKAKLATVLAVVTREAHNIGNGTTPPNEYLVAMEQGVRELEAFAAVLYSSNFDVGLPPSGPDSTKLSAAAATSSSSSPPEILGEMTGVDGNEDRAASLIDLGQSSVVAAPSARSKDDSATDPSASLPSGAVVDPAFEKVWGEATESSRKSDDA
jgi:peroxin-3